MNQAVLLDAGPLIHLDELGRLDFFRCFDEILVPAEVWSEACRHRPKLRLAALPNATVLEPAPPPSERLLRELEHFNLDPGESAALSWLDRLGGGRMVSDDGDARDAAIKLGFKIVGTLGLIIMAHRRTFVSGDEARALFDRIKTDTTLHASTGLIQELKAQLPE
jgi:predicted nucleic acid-binding protein